jgi:hypothetical protein
LDASRLENRLRAKFPVPVQKAELIPCCRELISLFGRAGELISQVTEFAYVFETDFRRKRLNRRNSLFLSLLAGIGLSGHPESIHGEPQRSRLSGRGAQTPIPRRRPAEATQKRGGESSQISPRRPRQALQERHADG